jgi:hypothetical protein
VALALASIRDVDEPFGAFWSLLKL